LISRWSGGFWAPRDQHRDRRPTSSISLIAIRFIISIKPPWSS